MDCVHILLEMCAANLKNIHTNGKNAGPTRVYEVSVCRRLILHSTPGDHGKKVDKDIVRSDLFVDAVLNRAPFTNFAYKLHNENGHLAETKGAWLLVDNGYHHWTILMHPEKMPTKTQQAWTDITESVRKDVECTFGILKKRYNILKVGLRYHRTRHADDIFRTCCAMHNQLLFLDGFHTEWSRIGQNSAQDEKELDDNAINAYDDDDQNADADIDAAVSALSSRGAPRVNALWRENAMGARELLTLEDVKNVAEHKDYKAKKTALINHFNYIYSQGFLDWQRAKN